MSDEPSAGVPAVLLLPAINRPHAIYARALSALLGTFSEINSTEGIHGGNDPEANSASSAPCGARPAIDFLPLAQHGELPATVGQFPALN